MSPVNLPVESAEPATANTTDLVNAKGEQRSVAAEHVAGQDPSPSSLKPLNYLVQGDGP
jgi:hypothetical protein